MITVKDIHGHPRCSVPLSPGAIGKFSLMKEDYVVLPFSSSSPVDFQTDDYVNLRGVFDASMGGKLAKTYQIVDMSYPTYNASSGGMTMSFVLTPTTGSGKRRYSSTPLKLVGRKRPGPLPLHWMSRWVYSFAI